LDQNVYNAMDLLAEQKIAPDVAAEVIRDLIGSGATESIVNEATQTISDVATTTAETAGQAAQTTAEGIVGATEAGGVIDSVDTATNEAITNATNTAAEAATEPATADATAEIEATEEAMTETDGLVESEAGAGTEFKNATTKEAWGNLEESLKDRDSSLRDKAFGKICQENGILKGSRIVDSDFENNKIEITVLSKTGETIQLAYNALENKMVGIKEGMEVIRTASNLEKVNLDTLLKETVKALDIK
jgi:hypothetical protein